VIKSVISGVFFKKCSGKHGEAATGEACLPGCESWRRLSFSVVKSDISGIFHVFWELRRQRTGGWGGAKVPDTGKKQAVPSARPHDWTFQGDKSDISGLFDGFRVEGSGSGRRRRGNFARAGGRPGAHGVTRPTNDGLATGLFDFIAHFGVRVKREGTLAGGEMPGRRCAGGRLGPARTLILWGGNPWQSGMSMAGFRETGLLAANAFLKINAKKVTDPLAANNPVFPNPATLPSDAGLPPSSPEGESAWPSD